jgi:predicted nucleic acid-binding protein
VSEYYLDASVLVKRYAAEPGSAWILEITGKQAQHTILLSEITPQQRERALSRFLQDCDEHFLLLPVDRLVIDRAVVLTQNHRLLGYDGEQLATALVTNETLRAQSLSPIIFVASDDDLLTAAAMENLATDNPPDHSRG